MARFAISISAGFVVVACEPGYRPAPVTDAMIEDCNARGGEVVRDGRLGSAQCAIANEDAGTPCRDGSECQGRCLLDAADRGPLPTSGTPAAGFCEATNVTFGCFAEINNGQIDGGFVCVD